MGDLPSPRIERASIGPESEPEKSAERPKEKTRVKAPPQAIPEIAEQDDETHELDTLA